MLQNLSYWHDQALTLGSSDDPADRALARIARSQAQRCAVDAAPFVHPRLSNTTLSGDQDNPIRVSRVSLLSDAEVVRLLEIADAGGSVIELLDEAEDADAP
jgi:hypothetical protein